MTQVNTLPLAQFHTSLTRLSKEPNDLFSPETAGAQQSNNTESFASSQFIQRSKSPQGLRLIKENVEKLHRQPSINVVRSGFKIYSDSVIPSVISIKSASKLQTLQTGSRCSIDSQPNENVTGVAEKYEKKIVAIQEQHQQQVGSLWTKVSCLEDMLLQKQNHIRMLQEQLLYNTIISRVAEDTKTSTQETSETASLRLSMVSETVTQIISPLTPQNPKFRSPKRQSMLMKSPKQEIRALSSTGTNFTNAIHTLRVGPGVSNLSPKLEKLKQTFTLLGNRCPVKCDIDQTGYLKYLDSGTYIIDSKGNLFELCKQEISMAIEASLVSF